MPNPRTKEFPLRHKFAMDFTLQEFETSAADFATMIPLFVADQAKTEALAQAVQTNRANDAYEGIVNTPHCFMNSRVNKIKITEYVSIPPSVDLPDAIYSKAVISWGLGDSDIKDPQGNTLLGKLKFTKAADSIHPTYNGTDLLDGGFFNADVDGLTTNGHIEQIALSPSTLRDQRESSLGPKIRKMVIGPMMSRVHKDFPYFRERWYDVPGSVKRMNSFTGCFLYVGMNTVKSAAASAIEVQFSPHFDAELTIDEDSLSFHYLIEYNEYHDSFDYSA